MQARESVLAGSHRAAPTGRCDWPTRVRGPVTRLDQWLAARAVSGRGRPSLSAMDSGAKLAEGRVLVAARQPHRAGLWDRGGAPGQAPIGRL